MTDLLSPCPNCITKVEYDCEICHGFGKRNLTFDRRTARFQAFVVNLGVLALIGIIASCLRVVGFKPDWVFILGSIALINLVFGVPLGVHLLLEMKKVERAYSIQAEIQSNQEQLYSDDEVIDLAEYSRVMQNKKRKRE